MIFRSIYNKPILLIGNGVRNANAVELVHEFARKHHIPLLTTMNAVDIGQDNLHIGFIGTHGNRVANLILQNCDLVVSVGARLSIRQVGKNTSNFAPHADLVRVDLDENELTRDIKSNEIKLLKDAKDFMEELLREDVGDYSGWLKKCLDAKEFLEAFDKPEGNKVVETISSLLPKDAIVAVDVGQNQCWAAQSLHLRGNNPRILIGGGYGTMGCGLPYAIGASIAKKDSIIYAICGDGGLQMNIQELETIHRENLPIKIFVLNNRVLGKISETQRNNHDKRYMATTESGGYTVPDFVKIAEAYGIASFDVDSYLSLNKFKKEIEDNKPHLFNISMGVDSLLEPKIDFVSGVIMPKLDKEVYQKVCEILQG